MKKETLTEKFKREQKDVKRKVVLQHQARKQERRRVRKAHWKTRQGSTFRT